MKTITRKELYDKIWSITKKKTAIELNLKYQDLTKICQEHNIPTPLTTYWQKLSWGEEVEKTPLPDSNLNTVISLDPKEKPSRKVLPNRRKQDAESATSAYSEILDAELAKAREEKNRKKLLSDAVAGKFVVDLEKPFDAWIANAEQVLQVYRVPEQLKSRREIVLQTKAYFRLNRLCGYEQMSHPDYERLRTHLSINVSEDLNDRALRMFDTIISIYEVLGGRMKYDRDRTSVVFGDAEIGISISERNKRTERPPEEERYGFKYNYVSSGLLRVKLEWRWRDYKIEDTDYTKIEDKLDVIVHKTLAYVKDDMEWKEQQRQQELERRRKEEEQRLEEERRRQLELLRQEERAEAHRLLNTLRRQLIVGFIDDVLRRTASQSTPDDAASEANAYAIKLAALKDLFDPNRSAELDTNLTEADIDALAAEFFGTQTEKEHKQSYAPSTPFRYQ